VAEPEPGVGTDDDPAGEFAAFYTRERPGVVTMLAMLTGDLAPAEELTQEAFLRAFVRWRRVREYDRPDLWVRRVGLNLAVSGWRRRRAEERAVRRAVALATRPVLADGVGELDGDVWAVVRTLPRRQAQVVALRYVEDRTDEEIAVILGCATGTVRSHLQRARVSLTERLGSR
jgi:RNA polymerase sigma-70 factor (sigma-E family)